MKTILGLMVVALFAYLGSALFRVPRLPPSIRALISSGIGFFGVGLALGPLGVDLLDKDVVTRLDVFTDLGIGWVGLLFGLQFNLDDLRRLPGRNYWGAFTESTLAMLVCALGLALVALQVPVTFPALVIVVLAAAGATSSPTAVVVVQHDLSPRGAVIDALRLFTSVDAVPAILVLGIAFCLAPTHPARFGPLLDPVFWVAVSLGLGLSLGALFHLLTLYRYSDNQLLVIVLGLVVFCGGAAHYLVLSSLFVNFLVGVVVANRSPQRLRVLRALVSVEKPIYLILLTLAGALWHPPVGWLWVLVAGFVGLRAVGKLVGGYGAAPVARLAVGGSFGIGPGLLAQGGMGVVIVLSFGQIFPGSGADLVLTAVMVSVLVTTLIGPWSLKQLLVREGEAQ